MDIPDNKLLVYAEAQIRRRITVVGSTEYNSARFSTSYGIEADAFLVANLKASVRLQRYVSLEGGVNNILDRSYALAECFPEPGAGP